ncbi:MAG: complex I subunit 5 family protein [Candidatus Thorarchaeota archaeon]|jgi:proton-translocating NADH-quinone oxidoreductase chain N
MTIGITEWIQLIPLWLPFVGALFIALLGRFTKERNKWLLGAISTVFFFLALWFLISPLPPFQGLYFQLVNAGFTPIDIVYFVTTPLDPSLGSAFFRIDILTVYMSVIFIFLGFFVSLYSIKYMEHDTRLSIYYALLLTLVGGMVGVVMAGDFFTLFILWETMSISSYVLVAFRKDEAEPLEAGIKYLLLSAVGSTLILFTMSLLYGLTGTLNLYQIGPAISLIIGAATPGSPIQGLLLFTIVGLIIGFGVKAAIAPLSTWLPDAHPAAPSGISAMLSGVVIMTGAYAIIRILVLFYNPTEFPYYGAVVSWFALFTMIYGNLMALTQQDLKRLLAYSTIVNVGYIIFGFSIAMMPIVQTAQITSVTGSLFHITSHMLAKGMLFLISGIFLHSLNTRDLDKLRGVGRSMPLTMLCLTIGALSLAGVPPLIGFYSKFYIIWGAIEAGAYIASIIMVLMSAFSVVYYLRILQILVFAEPSPEAANVKPTHPILLVVIGVLTIFIIGIGLFPGFFVSVADLAAQGALGLLP